MISTPDELLEYMSDFSYEWMDKQGNFHKDIIPEMYNDYSFMMPSEVLKYKKGICVDQTEFERDWFNRHNYEHRVMNIQIDLQDESPGHAFLIYKEGDKYCWFENAWYDERGIHKYESYNDLINDIKKKFIIQNDISTKDISKLQIFESPQYPYHLSYSEMDKYKTKIKK